MVQTADFEDRGLPSGDIIGQILTPAQLGVTSLTIQANDPEPTSVDLGLNFEGFNITPGGANHLSLGEFGSGEPDAELQFNFADPIVAFGLYLSGGGTLSGLPTINAGGDSINVVKHGDNSTGLQFIGFTSDTPLTQVTFQIAAVGGLNSLFFLVLMM